MITVQVDYNTNVTYKGKHRDVYYQISSHAFKDECELSFYDFPVMWATYVLLSQEQHDKFKHRIDLAPWNGGVTFNRKITEEHLDCPQEFIEKLGWNKPYYKIGDDFAHLWDHEDRRFVGYNRQSMERHIKRVIDYLIDGDKED